MKGLALAPMAAMFALLVGVTAAKAERAITTTDLDLYAGPSIQHEIVSTVPAGTVVNTAGEDGGWRYLSWQGVGGWVYARYLARPQGSKPALSRYIVAPDFSLERRSGL